MKIIKGNFNDSTLDLVCSICGKKYKYIYKNGSSSGSSKKKCNSCHANSGRFDKKDRMIEYKGGRCQICGYNKCNRALTFHHLDPSKKDFNFAGSHIRKWEIIKGELDKCILLCQNCHNEVHAGITKIS
jgi:hypothetical protein